MNQDQFKALLEWKQLMEIEEMLQRTVGNRETLEPYEDKLFGEVYKEMHKRLEFMGVLD